MAAQPQNIESPRYVPPTRIASPHNPPPVLSFHPFASQRNSTDVLMQGELLKLGNVHRAFKSRYFVLYTNRNLAYWQSHTAEIYGQEPINIIEMQTVRAIKIVNKPPKQKKGKREKDNEGRSDSEIGDDIVIDFEKTRYFCFELRTKRRTYLLCCDDAVHFNDWIMHLNNAVFGKKLFKGWFFKQGGKHKSWRKRWFVVYDTLEMRYYENQKGSNPKGAILLTELTEMKMVLNKDKYPKHKEVMELKTPERIWVLSAPSKNDREIWFNRLCDLIEKTGNKKCFRLNPIYKSYLFQLNLQNNLWNLLYFALTSNHLFYFESAKQCNSAQSMAYFDNKAHFLQAIVGGLIPLNKPQFSLCDEDICKKYKRQYLFEIDTSFNKLLLSSKRITELEEWQKALIKHNTNGNNNEFAMDEKESKEPIDMLQDVMIKKYSKQKKGGRKSHSTSNSMNFSMVTHYPGHIKHKKDDDDAVIGDGDNETSLPPPKPRKPTNFSSKHEKKKNIKKEAPNYKNYMMKRLGGAGITGKVKPMRVRTEKHLYSQRKAREFKVRKIKTERNVFNQNVRDRGKSHSLNEVMFQDIVSGATNNDNTRNRVDMYSITSMGSLQSAESFLNICATPSRHTSIDSMHVNSSTRELHKDSLFPPPPPPYTIVEEEEEEEEYQEEEKKSVLAIKADESIVLKLMELGFVNKEQCVCAAIAVNNRSTEEASQWLFHNVDHINEESKVNDDDDDIYDDDLYTLFVFQINDKKEEIETNRLNNDEEHRKISCITDPLDRAHAYFDCGLWNKAIREYTLSLNEIDYDIEWSHPFAYTLYCLRSECYRRLKKLSKAECDTSRWMELQWNRDDFEYITGCDIGSKVYIDMKEYIKARKLVIRGINLAPQHSVLEKRLKKLDIVLRKELNSITAEIDRYYLEYDIDEIVMNEAFESNKKKSLKERAMTVVSDWSTLIGSKSCLELEIESRSECLMNIDLCPCSQRILVILKFYDQWCKTQEFATILDRISIYNIMAYLESYSLHQLMNDYIHIKEAHIDDLSHNRCSIFDYFIVCLPPCLMAECKCFARNNRNRLDIDSCLDKFNSMYFNFSAQGEAHDIITMQILDSLHTFCLHSTQCVMMKIPKKEEEIASTSILSTFLDISQNAMNDIASDWNKVYKFKSSIKILNNEDRMRKYWKSFKNESHYIAPKYKTLKRELMNNAIYKLSEPQWFMCLLRAHILKQTFKGKMWSAKDVNNGDLNDKCCIPQGLPIPTTHLMVLLLYTNNVHLQYEFKNRAFIGDDNHREIANFAQILEECIQFYSHSNDLFIRSAIFYHALNDYFLMDKFEFVVNSPILLTLEPSTAMMICNEASNCVLKLRAQHHNITDCKLLDISWITDNPQTNAFLTNQSTFNVLDIINNYQSNQVFITAIILFKRLVKGYFIQDLIHPKQVFQYIILGLMSNMSEGYAKHSNIPLFIQSIFEHIVNRINQIWIIQTQYQLLGNDFKTCFFDLNDECITTGPFYDFWSNHNQHLTVNLTQQFEWNLFKTNDLTHFWALKPNQSMDGPQCKYIIDDDDDDDQEEEEEEEAFICFVPFIKKNKNNVSIGMRLKEQSSGLNYKNIDLQYNLLCQQLSYTMSNNVKLSYTMSINNEFIAFNINQMRGLNSFHFQISLRVLSLQ